MLIYKSSFVPGKAVKNAVCGNYLDNVQYTKEPHRKMEAAEAQLVWGLYIWMNDVQSLESFLVSV